MVQIDPRALTELVPTGRLRVAINLGNPVLAQRTADGGELQGVSVALAGELARRIGVPLEFVVFDSAGEVFQAMQSGGLDLVFLAIDPARADEILFTAPYVVIEGTYVVRDDSPLRRLEDFDAEEVRIAVGRGAAYDLFLSRTLRSARLERAENSQKALDLFVEQRLEAAAGVRLPLERFAATHPGYRVIEGAFTSILQAMGTPAPRHRARDLLASFVEEAKASGFVREALVASGRGDTAVAPAQPL